jgi:uncharacterized membrane protein YhaH (DUF805 family)
MHCPYLANGEQYEFNGVRSDFGGHVGTMGTSGSKLPHFAFPVVAWAPEPATGRADDDGTREFLAPHEVTSTYFPDSDLRLGWTFVDAEGRCWEAVSSHVTGRADAWCTWWLPRWLYNRKYRLALDFAERPPMSFDAVRTRLHAAVTANPQAYRGWAGKRRKELRSAESLHDLIKSEETRAIERFQPTTLWWQWLLGEGRCSRRAFLAIFATLIAATWLATLWLKIPAPALLIVLLPFVLWWVSATVQRVHDLGRSIWWMAVWAPFSILCALVHDTASVSAVKAVAASTWQISTLCLLAFLALAPGTRGPNRYGP